MNSLCLSCNGSGKVLKMFGFDKDYYPTFVKAKCPSCHGTGFVDSGELFVVPRGLIKDEFFVSSLYTEDEQNKLRAVLEEERKWFEKLK